MANALFQQTGFTDAKRHLSELMTEVVHEHRPVQVNRHAGKEQMFLVARRELEDLLELSGQRFETRVIFDEGEVVVSLPAFSLIGAGESFDEAVDDLLAVLRQYCAQYLERLEFYRQTDRRSLLALVFLFSLTPPEEQRELLLHPPEGRA
ncbi:MAG: type II toxin-antitoxin system prevent-host-death family antitoxin [Solirubrobacteraceae bacterium]